MSFITAKNLTRRYDLSDPWIVRQLTFRPKRFLTAVNDVSFSVEKGTTYALVGESGSGKSTIAKMAVGLLAPSAGTITLDNHNLNDRNLSPQSQQSMRRRIQMVFQSPYASLNPRWRVGDILAEPIQSFDLIQGAKNQAKRVDELLEQVGLSPSDAKKYPHEFSGGQRQRISLARSLLINPQILLFDEPTSFTDDAGKHEFSRLLRQSLKDKTIIIVTHDQQLCEVADKVYKLDHGFLAQVQKER